MTDTFFSAAMARIFGLPLRLRRQRLPLAPKRAVILKPCCISQVMLTTPLLAALVEAFPEATFDWVISDWARPAIAANPGVRHLINSGHLGLKGMEGAQKPALIERLRRGGYDSCFIPSRSSLLSYIAWRAGIGQRIGLSKAGRGFAHTFRVGVGRDLVHEAELYLKLAEALGVGARPNMVFCATDAERIAITRRLTEDIGWQMDEPLVVLHPGGGENPVRPAMERRWPAARYSLLGGRLARDHGARVIVVGDESDRRLAEDVYGMMHIDAPNLAGQLSLGELGALCEVADLYVGNDAGPTHVAAAVGCRTLAIFGPTDPARVGPYGDSGPVICLGGGAVKEPFSWDEGVTVDEALEAATELLALERAERAAEPGAA
jgi:ADP-heptose:LPS heptosyltransferase